MAEAPTIDVKFQVSEQSAVIVPLAELLRLATATAEMGRALAKRPRGVREAEEKLRESQDRVRVVMTQGRDEILRLQRELDEALARLAEVERERDEARAEVEDLSVSRAYIIGLATTLSDALELEQVPVEAVEQLRELRRWLARFHGHEIIAADRPG